MSASNSGSAEASVSSSGANPLPAAPPPPLPPAKKKRNLPGTPDPGAEVVALSPTTLMATNRFVCEICGKGFQRDQNLQLHRRGHNLPWKLRQRAGAEQRRRRVYVCPEPGCVHHDPARALGDLTGIKKHFSRKHGEKKWRCDKCSKKYAVQSDLKAHAKTCGTREYRCDCGILFSRRDSFITHRAFCDALAVESARAHSEHPPPPTPPTIPSAKKDDKVLDASTEPPAGPEDSVPPPPQQPEPPEEHETESTAAPTAIDAGSSAAAAAAANSSISTTTTAAAVTTSLFASLFTSAAGDTAPAQRTSAFSDLIRADEPPLLGLPSEIPTSLFAPPSSHDRRPAFAASPHLSATALLQKAAQIGAASSNSSFLEEFGLAMSSSEKPQQEQSSLQWHQELEPAAPMLSAGLGLGLGLGLRLAYDTPDLMMGGPNSTLFGPKPATLDFLGLGMGPVGGSAAGGSGGLSALITSMGGGGLDLGVGTGPSAGAFGSGSAQAKPWEGAERKPSSPAIL